jgi:hypothetical protein
MPGDEVDDDDIVDRLNRIFKDMPAYTSCPVPRALGMPSIPLL